MHSYLRHEDRKNYDGKVYYTVGLWLNNGATMTFSNMFDVTTFEVAVRMVNTLNGGDISTHAISRKDILKEH
jgi:hypothetical protein